MVVIHFQEALSQLCVFGIDDAHWIDADSWTFLFDLSVEPNAILVLTSCPLNKVEHKPPAMQDLLRHPDTKVINLEGLTPECMVKLACQKLEVDSIPQEIEEIIHKRSHGVPLWCEELVQIMLDLNFLEITSKKAMLNVTQKKRWKKIKIYEDTLPSATRTSLPESYPKLQTGTTPTTKLSGVEFGDIPIPDSVAGIVLARIDHMSASDQMTLKCAAIAGTTFKRTLLQAIVPNCDANKFYKSLNVLADSGILECAVAAELRRESTAGLHGVEQAEMHCTCLEINSTSTLRLQTNKAEISTTPRKSIKPAATSTVNRCETLQFVHTYIQETVYYLWTESQRKNLHETAAHFLEQQAHRCKNCGEGPFTGGNQSILEHRKLPVGAGRPLIGRLIPVTAGVDDGSFTCDMRKFPSMTVQSSKGSSSFIPKIDSKQNNLAIEIEMKIRTHLDKIYFSNTATMDVEMLECHCDKIISNVYPQLVRHWRAAGNLQNTIAYLIEAGAAAAVTGKNMEALALLQEAKNIAEQGEAPQLISKMEHGRIYSLVGQVSCSTHIFDNNCVLFNNPLPLPPYSTKLLAT